MPRLRLYRAFIVLLLVACALLASRWLPSGGTSLANAPDVPWANPIETAFHNTGPVILSGEERRYDCTPLTYRLRDDRNKTMRTGCFVPASFGMLDPGQSIVIFNGTDEGELIRYGGQSAALSILPYSGSVARFGGFPGAGSYMYLYTNFLAALQPGGNFISGRWKEITSLPNFTVTDPSGQPLAVNPLALAYAPRGQWMVTESPNKSLVRVNLATYSLLPFDKSFAVPTMPYASHEGRLAITENGRYAAVASNEHSSFKVYDLKNCTPTSVDDPLLPQACPAHDYWTYLVNQVAGTMRKITKVSFVTDDVIRLEIETTGRTESYLLSPKGTIDSLIPYLGLGDSYASGQGAFNYLAGTDTNVNHCHTSARSYPLLLNGDLFGGRGKSVACSGARIHDINNVSPNYTGQTTDQRSVSSREADGSEVTILQNFTPGYLSQTSFVNTYRPGAMTVQIGGNDVGFGAMILRCLSPVASVKNLVMNPNSCYQTYEDRLEIAELVNRTYPRWVQLYRHLQQQSPASRIYAVGYPHILSPNAQCGLNVHMTLAEIQFARDATNYLNNVISRAARAAGVQYVDIGNALKDHELCSGNSSLAVNGITAGNDAAGVLGQESFHPNALGHELIEQAILRTTNNLTRGKPAAEPNTVPPAANDQEPLLQAPRSGRSLTNVIPTDSMVTGDMKLGGVITMRFDGGLAALKPNTVYQICLGDTLIIGTLTTDAQGNLHGSVTVPAGANAGVQPVSVIGGNQHDTPTTIVQIIYVNNSSNDYDGDGIINDQDSCPLIVNSGVDQDGDGVDDACDASIQAPAEEPADPALPPNPTNPVDDPSEPEPNPQDTSPAQPASPPHQPTSNPQLPDFSPLPILATTRIGSGQLKGVITPKPRPIMQPSSIKMAQKKMVVSVPGGKHPSSAKSLPKLGVAKFQLPIFQWWLWAGLLLLLVLVTCVTQQLARTPMRAAR